MHVFRKAFSLFGMVVPLFTTVEFVPECIEEFRFTSEIKSILPRPNCQDNGEKHS